MLDKIISFADELNMLPESGLILVCVSGGMDSMCLFEALMDISAQRGFCVGIAHYNHRLRGNESARDEKFVRDYCAVRDVPFYAGSGGVREHAKKHKLGIEEAAREMRYNFFFSTAEIIGAQRIATAHTADDNAETIILNLTRGAGAAGLSGIPPIRGMHRSANVRRNELPLHNSLTLGSCGSAKHDIMIIRPMLLVSRDEVVHFIKERGIPFSEDSTNSLDIFTRNKVRHDIIPVIREINPRFNEAAATAAALSRADEEYLSKIAESFIIERCKGASAPLEELLELPFAVSGRVIRKLCGGSLSYRHVRAVLQLCGCGRPSAKLSLPGTTVCKEYDRIVFGGDRKAAADGFAPVHPKDGDCVPIPGLSLKLTCKSVIYDDIMHRADGRDESTLSDHFAHGCGGRAKHDIINKSLTSFQFKCVEICGKMTVRPRREGDKIKFFGQNGTKTLKKLFIERRIPAGKRTQIPVVADDCGVLAVYGMGRGDRAVPKRGDLALLLDFKEMQ